MVSTLTKNAIDLMINNLNEPNEEYVIQIIGVPSVVAESLYKIQISDGFARTKKGYIVSEAASRWEEIKDLSILKVKKFITPTDPSQPQNVDKERIIIGTFEILYTNVTDLIGKPIEYKTYRNSGFSNQGGSIIIPEKYLSRNVGNKNGPVGAGGVAQGGRPVPSAFANYNSNNSNNNYNNNNNGSSNPQGHNRVTQNPLSMYGQNNQQRPPGGMQSANQDDERDLERISSLSPQSDGSFKARITKKGEMKNFRSQKGEGTLFSADVIDAYGSEITISFFNQEAAKFFSYIQVEQVYIFKAGQVKQNNNKTFNKGDVIVTITKETQIMAAQDDGKIPFMAMNRKRIAEIQSLEKDKCIDIIGFVRENTESRVITLKDQNQKQRRDIKVYDESRQEIEISLWGDNADRVNAREADLIVIKDARVGEYREKKQINIGYNTQIFLNPDLEKFPEAKEVQLWRNNNDLTSLIAEFQSKTPSLANGSGNGENAGGLSVPPMAWESSIIQLREEINIAKVNNQFSDEFKIWREVRGLVHFVKDTPLYYDSCEKCKKKAKLDVDRWFCEQCQTSSDEPTSRYIATVLIADSTDQMWVSVFDEVAKKIFGYSANEFRRLGDNTDERKKKLQQVQYKEFRFLLLTRSERDPSTGLYREKTIIHQIKDDLPLLESKRILNSLEKYLELE